MNRAQRHRVIGAFLGMIAGCGVSWGDEAIIAEHAWVRDAPPNAEMNAGYLNLQNHSAQTQTLIGVSSPQFQKVEIHDTRMVDGKVHMQRENEVAIAAHGSLEFNPGAYHLMLIHPLHPLKEGDMVELRLQFDKVPQLTVQAPIRKSEEPKDSHHGHGMQDMQDMKM